MKTSWKKRMISALLALTMVFSYLPAGASAADNDWLGNDETIHLTGFKVNTDGTWSVTLAGSGTTNGALAIVPNFHPTSSGNAMGSLRGDISTTATEAALKGTAFGPTGTTTSVKAITGKGAGTYTNAQLGMDPVDSLATLQGKFNSYFAGNDVGGGQVTDTSSFPFIAIFVAGTFKGENRSYRNADMVSAASANLTANDVLVVLSPADYSVITASSTLDSVITNIGGGNAVIDSIAYNDLNLETALGQDMFRLNNIADNDTIEAGKGVTATFEADDYTNALTLTTSVTGYISVNYHTDGDSKSKTLKIKVEIRLANTPKVIADPSPLIFEGTISYDDDGNVSGDISYTTTPNLVLKSILPDGWNWADYKVHPGDMGAAHGDGSDMYSGPTPAYDWTIGEMADTNIIFPDDISPEEGEIPAIYTITPPTAAGLGNPKISTTTDYRSVLTIYYWDDVASVTSTLEVTLIARITPEAKTEKVTVKFDGGTKPTGITASVQGVPGDITIDKGSSIPSDKIPADPTLDGCSFEGWYTAGGTKVDLTTQTFEAETTTLYAHWKKLPTITFDANNGKWADNTTKKTATVDGTTKKVTAPTDPARAKDSTATYKFAGWSTTKDAANTKVNLSTETFDVDDTLYALWDKLFTVTYDLDGGTTTGPSDAQTQASAGASVKLHSGTVTKTVGTAKYYSTKWVDSEGNEYDHGYDYTPTANVTLKPKWLQYLAVVFHNHLPTGAQESDLTWPSTIKDLENQNNPVSVAEPADPSLKNYTFKGWSTDKAGTNMVTTWPHSSNTNVDLWAQWDALPKITGATLTDSIKPAAGNNTATLATITLDKGNALTASDAINAGHVIVEEWCIGSSAGSSTSGPSLTGTSLGTSITSDIIPAETSSDLKVWVKLKGDGVHVDETSCWQSFNIGADRLDLTVSYKVFQSDGTTADTTNPSGISATGHWSLTGSGTDGKTSTGIQTISTTSVNNGYKFVGWALNDDDTGDKLTGNYEDSTSHWTLTDFDPSTIAEKGVNKATVTAPATIPDGGVIVKLCAVYVAVPTYSLKVETQNGIASVTVMRVRDGVATELTAGEGGVYSDIRATDTISITSEADDTHVTDGFDPENAPAGLAYDSNTSKSTLIVHINKDTYNPDTPPTVTAKAKEKEKEPAKLTLTPSAGSGTTDGVTSGKEPKVTVANIGEQDATEATVSITGVTADGAAFGTGAAGFTIGAITDNKVEPGSDKKQALTISVPNTLTAGKTYYIAVTVTYKDGKNTDAQTVSTVVGYTVAATFTGTVTVKLDGTAQTAAVVTLNGGSDISGTAADGVTTFTGLTIGTDYTITVDLDGPDGEGTAGKTYSSVIITPEKVSNSNKDVIVNFYTVTVKHRNEQVDQIALDYTTTDSKNAKVTLTLNTSVEQDATKRKAEVVKGHITDRTAQAVVQAGTRLTLTATPADLKPGYEFDKWTKENTTTTSADKTYTITVDGTATYVASLKKSDASVAVVTYDSNVAHAPYIVQTNQPVIAAPPSQFGKTGETIKLTLETPKLAGYVFKGWSTEADPTNATTGNTYQPGATVHLGGTTAPFLTLNNEDQVTLYAIWVDDTITLETTSLDNGVYGTRYSATVSAHSESGNPVTVTLSVTDSGYALPGGLAISNATVSGKPYAVTATGTKEFKVKVTAALAGTNADYHDTDHQVGLKITSGSDTVNYKDLPITIKKATPVVTKVTINNVQSGGAIADADYIITVEGPRYKGGAAAGASADNDSYWENYTDTISYRTTSTKTGGIGTATDFTSDASDSSKFKALPDSTKVTLKFVPDTANTAFDGSATAGTAGTPATGNKQSDVWNDAPGTGTTGGNFDVKVSGGENGDNFGFTDSWLYAEETSKDPAHAGYTIDTTKTNGFVTGMTDTNSDGVDDGAGVVNAKDFTITAAGDQPTGALTAALGAGTDFEIVEVKKKKEEGKEDLIPDPDYMTATGDSLAAGGTTKIRVQVKDGKKKGVYTDTLTITGANGGKATIRLTFVVTDPLPFDAIIDLITDPATTHGGTVLPDNVKIMVDGKEAVREWKEHTADHKDDANPAATTHNHTNCTYQYRVTGLAVGKEYQVTVTGLGTDNAISYIVPKATASGNDYGSITLDTDHRTATLKLYQIETAYAGTDGEKVTQTGAGWYVHDQKATLTTDAAVHKAGSTDAYTFQNWDGDTNKNNTTLTIDHVTAKGTYTANYKKVDSDSTTITYYKNNTDNTPSEATTVATETVKKNATDAKVISAVPTAEGYIFQGWKINNEGDTLLKADDPLTVGESPIKLFAQWTPGKVLSPTGDGADDWNVTLPDGVYGTLYTYTVPMPRTGAMNGDTFVSDGSGVTFSATNLPGGLYINKDTGVISGKPYEVGTVNNVTITATHKVTGATLVKTNVSITIDKYQLSMTGTGVTNVVKGQGVDTANYTATIPDTTPILKTPGEADTDGTQKKAPVWETFTETVTRNNSTPGPESAKGTLSLTSGGTFTDSTKVGLQYTPSATATDGNSSKHEDIYKPATGTVTATTDGTYTMTVSPASHAFEAVLGYTVNGTSGNGNTDANNDVNTKQFTLTNTGSLATGALTWKWGSTGTQASTFFTLADNSTDSLPVKVTTEGHTTDHQCVFTVVPKAGLPTYASYTDILTITNSYGGSVTVTVTFKVTDPATYDADITTLLQSVEDYQADPQVAPAAGPLPTGGTVILKPVGNVANNGGEKTGFYDSTEKKYVFNTSTTGKDANALTYGESYTVCVNGYDVPGIVISNADGKRSAKVTLYQVTTAKTPDGGAASAPGRTKEYVVSGENVTVTPVSPSEGYHFKELTHATGKTADEGGVKQVKVTTNFGAYTQLVAHPEAFTAVYKENTDNVTLTYDPNGAVKPDHSTGKDPAKDTVTATNETVSGQPVLAATVVDPRDETNTGTEAAPEYHFGWTKPGYTFTGWNTETDGSGTAYAVGASLAVSADMTLYAQWKIDSALTLAGAEYTLAYKEAMPDNATHTAAAGNNTSYTYAAAVGDTAVASGSNIFSSVTYTNDTTNKNFTFAGTSEDYDGSDTLDNRVVKDVTLGVTVTDGDSATANAQYIFHLYKAKTDAKGFTDVEKTDGNPVVKAGDAFDFTKLDGTPVVDVLKHDDAKNEGVTLTVTPAADGTATDGKWSVTDKDGNPVADPKFLPGTNDYYLTFTPTDAGFLPSTQKITITLEKKIASVTVGITYPTSGVEINTAGLPKVVTATTNSPTIDATKLGDYVNIAAGDVAWTGGVYKDTDDNKMKFDTTQAITVIARVTTKDGWTFVDKDQLLGAFRNGDDATSDLLKANGVEILTMNTEHTEAFIQYTFAKENTPIQKVNVNPGDLVAGAYTTGWSVNDADVPKYYVDTTAAGYKVNDSTTVKTHWRLHTSTGEGTVLDGTSGKVFEKTENHTPIYDAVVVIRARDGYEFDPTVFAWDSEKTAAEQANLCDGTDFTKWKATANDGQPTEGAKTAQMQYALSADHKTLVIRYNSFPATDKQIVGVRVEGAPGVYYAKTEEKEKHYNTSATGNADGKVFALDLSNVRVYPIYADGSVGTTHMTSGYTIGKGTTEATFVQLTDSHIFKDGYTPTGETAEAADVAAWDGQTLYVRYAATVGGKTTTTYTALDAPLVVKKLTATSITGGSGWSITSDNKFQIPETTPTATVTFNAGDPMENTKDVTYAERGDKYGLKEAAKEGENSTTPKTIYRPNFYYMLDVNNDHDITDADTELKHNDVIAKDNLGKPIYACYTDVNGNLVKVQVNTKFTVSIEDENDHDHEYKDKLTADPKKPDGTSDAPDNYTYQWEKWTWKTGTSDDDKKNPDNIGNTEKGSWAPIPDADDRDYRPGKDDVKETIRVVVTDKTSGTPVPSDPVKIEPRSINFIVDVKDKKYDGGALNKYQYNKDGAQDFHPIAVTKDYTAPTAPARNGTFAAPSTGAYGGVWGDDTVTITPAGTWNTADASRPPYDNANKGSEITWTEVVEVGWDTATEGDPVYRSASKLSDYTVSGTTNTAGVVVYRLAPQDKQLHRGKITDGTVTHVDVSFKEVPTFDHVIPGAPMGVTDSRETQAGEASAATDQTYTATWYTGVTAEKNFDPTNSTLPSGVTKLTLADDPATKYGAAGYTVVVKVKPQPGYSYNLDDATKDKTRFNFHFGELIKEEVTQVANGVQGLKTVKEDGVDVYYMWYTFTAVTYPKIAHVNVSVPQPVVQKSTSDVGNPSVVLALGEDGSKLTAYVEPESVSWSLSSGDFVADVEYTLTFDVTVKNKDGSGYAYLNNTTATDYVKFIIGGSSPINGAGNATTKPNVIKSVTTATPEGYDADNKYKVTVVFNKLTGGISALTDVYVDASIPEAGGTKTGPEVKDAPNAKPYQLTGSDNKWYYLTSSNTWAEAETTADSSKGLDKDGKFLPGTKYRVTATVTLKEDEKKNYTLTTDGTAFFLAGQRCTTDEATSYSGDKYTPLTANQTDGKPNGTFTLIREFSTPSGIVNVMDISVTYPEPVSEKNPAADPSNYADQNQVVIAAGSDTANTGTKWYTTNLPAAPADRDAIEALTTSSGGGLTAMTLTGDSKSAFADGTYYMVEAKISSKDSTKYAFVTDNTEDDVSKNTRVNINGVIVNVGGAMGVKYSADKDASGNPVAIGWAIATANADGTITAKYIAKTAAVNRVIKEVTASVTAPSDGGTRADKATVSGSVNTEDQNVTPTTSMAVDASSQVTIANNNWQVATVADSGTTWGTFTGAFVQGGVYKTSFELTVNAAGGYSYQDAGGKDNDQYVTFNINGITVTAAKDTTDNKIKGSTTAANGTIVSVERKGDSGANLNTYTVTIQFPAIGQDKQLLEVTVDYAEPVENQHPAGYNPNYTPTDVVELNQGLLDAVPTAAVTVLAGTGSVWYAGEINKNNVTGKTALTAESAFSTGKYTVVTVFKIKNDEKVQFSNSTKFIVNGSSGYTAEANPNNVVIISGGKTAIVYHTFDAISDKEVVRVKTAVTAPVGGAAVSAKADTTSAQNKSNVEMVTPAINQISGNGEITWYKTGDTTKTPVTGNFDYNTAYTATFDLKVNTTGGYSYRAVADDPTTTTVDETDFVDFIINAYKVKDGKLVAEDTEDSDPLNVKKDTADTKTTVTYSDDAGTTTVTLTKKNAETYTVTIAFPATAANVQKVLEVHVDTVLPPVYKTPIPGVAVRNNQPYQGVANTVKWQSYTKDTDDDGTPDDWEDVTAGATFQNGVQYRVTGQVTLKSDPTTIYRDYDISDATEFYIGEVEIPQTATTATRPTGKNYTVLFAADGAADGTTKLYPDETVYTVTLTYDALVENKVIVDFVGNVIDVPVTGGTISSSRVSKILAHNEDGDDVKDHVLVQQKKVGEAFVDDITWESSANGTSGWTTVTDDTFERDTYYRATFVVEADAAKGYSFKAAAPDYIDFLINSVVGEDGSWINGENTAGVTANGVTVTTKQNSSNKYTIKVAFPQTKDKADVLTVWGLAAPKAGDTISASGLTVPSSEPYEKVSADTKWMHWDADKDNGTEADGTTPKPKGGWDDASGTFLPGHTYKAVIKTQLKTTGDTAGKYQFTSTTAGYINDTTAWNNKTDNTMDGTKVTYTKGSGTDANPQYITIERAFKIDKETVEVHVASNKPTKDAVASDVNATIAVPSAYQAYYKLLDASGTVEKAWYEENGTTPVTTFEEGKTYKLIVNVVAEEGYQLPEVTNMTQYIWDNNNAPAISVAANGTTSDGKDIYKVTFTYPIAKEGESQSPELAVTIPVKGATPAKPTSPNNSVIFGDDYKWTEKGGTSDVTTFTDGKTYVVTVYEPKKPDNTPYAEGDKIQFNEQTATVKKDADGKLYVEWEHSIPKKETEVIEKPGEPIYVGGGGGGGGTSKEIVVTYALREFGTTKDLTAEKIANKGGKPSKVPKVEPLEGLKFLGWSETDPSKLKDGKLPTLVDPTTFKIDKDKTFYAVYEEGEEYDHTHYVIGFPDGTFAPDANITRAEVATIIARSCLEGFVEGSDYGNPGNYTDVAEHWAFSAISYCSKNGVFNGYDDGTFRPDRFISRQELATVVARLAGMKVNQGMPFSDADEVADWAKNGVYTAFANRWINGYEDGSFRPLQDITRAETVRIFNGYLNRGVDADGLDGLKEYVHSGVASNNTENGKDEYMTWPDVPKSHWAYYEIIEAANDHNYEWKVNDKGELTETPPEDWYEVYIDEKWRYFDDANDNADNRGEDKITQVIVTYVVKSGGVVWDSKTEVVNRFESPSVAGLPNVTANEGFRFAGWSDVDPDTGAVNLVDPTANYVTEDTTFYAVFEEDKPYEMPKVTITYVITAHGSSDSALTETIDMYESPTVAGLPLVTAEPGYRFAGWTDTDPALGGYTFLDPTASPAETDKTFYAVFESEQAAEQDKVTVTYVVGDYGTTDAALTEVIDKYESPTVEALPQVTPVEGYRFVGWSTLDPATGMTNEVDPTASYLLEDTTFYAVLVPNQSDGPVNNTPVEPSEQPEQPVEEPEQPTEEPEQPVEEPTEPVTYARTKYISGFEDGTFRPDESITRAAVANIIAGLTGYDKDEVYADKGLTDLEGHWAKNVIAYCVSAGLMGGYEDGTFRPDQSMSRQELAVVMARLSGDVLESQGLDFADADAVATWAQDGVYTACANGWMKGYEDGSFLPERQVTRAEAVKMFNAYLDRSADPEAIGSQSGYTVWADVPETHWAYYEILEASNNWAE